MLQTYDLPAVRLLAGKQDERLRGCNDEGMLCASIDARILCHLESGLELWDAVKGWKWEVFSGRIPFDSQVEAEYKTMLASAVEKMQAMADEGQAEAKGCCDTFEKLSELIDLTDRLTRVQSNWVSPRRSAAPGPRTVLSEATKEEMRKTIRSVSGS